MPDRACCASFLTVCISEGGGEAMLIVAEQEKRAEPLIWMAAHCNYMYLCKVHQALGLIALCACANFAESDNFFPGENFQGPGLNRSCSLKTSTLTGTPAAQKLGSYTSYYSDCIIFRPFILFPPFPPFSFPSYPFFFLSFSLPPISHPP